MVMSSPVLEANVVSEVVLRTDAAQFNFGFVQVVTESVVVQ